MQTWARLTRQGMIACGLLALMATAAPAQPMPGDLRTNESDIVAWLRSGPLAIDDPVAVLAFVMGQLPERVQVYPSENYYYFRFVHKGVEYDGNIRLAVADRDRGMLKFAYFERSADWLIKPAGRYASLGAEQGVTVERVAPLTYRVTLNQSLGGKTVTFLLNDLSQARPPQGVLGVDEKFLGTSFDESGIRFFLVFNTKLKIFHFLLDETVSVADGLGAATGSDRILIGKRTGFAFYQDRGRKILIGVSARQSRLNTYYDGPFDQLPENFIEGEALREAIIAADPRVKGRVDRLGNYLSGDARFLIHPYLPYERVADLSVFHRCATSRSVAGPRRPLCFVIDDGEAQRPNPRPLALKRR